MYLRRLDGSGTGKSPAWYECLTGSCLDKIPSSPSSSVSLSAAAILFGRLLNRRLNEWRIFGFLLSSEASSSFSSSSLASWSSVCFPSCASSSLLSSVWLSLTSSLSSKRQRKNVGKVSLSVWFPQYNPWRSAARSDAACSDVFTTLALPITHLAHTSKFCITIAIPRRKWK